MTNVLSKTIDHSFQNAIRMIQNDTSLAADAETTFDDSIQTQEKSQQIISSHVEANSETTFDYCSPEIARKRAEDISDDIPDTGKIPKNYFELFCA